MTDEDLVEADRLEEDGRWEEAACLRLHGRVPGACTRHDLPGTLYVVAGPDGLHVGQWPFRCDGEWWLWRAGSGWRVLPAGGGPSRRAPLPADLRRTVAEAVRRALERRFGGSR